MSTPPPPSAPPAPDWPSAPDPPELPAGAERSSGRATWAPATALLAILGGLGAAIGAQLIISIVGALFGADLKHPPPSITIGGTVVQDICFVGAVIVLAGLGGRSVAPWQFGLRGTKVGRAIGLMALVFVALILFSLAWNALLGIHQSEKLPKELGVDRSHVALAFTALLVTTFAPAAEEMLFRGYVFPALRNWKGTWPAVVITGLLFGTLHVLSAPAYALAPLALFGALLCVVYLKTGSLYPCIALHSINNSVAFGSAPEVGWTWQIVPLAVAALALLALVGYAVRRRFGAPPAGLSPV